MFLNCSCAGTPSVLRVAICAEFDTADTGASIRAGTAGAMSVPGARATGSAGAGTYGGSVMKADTCADSFIGAAELVASVVTGHRSARLVDDVRFDYNM